MPFHPTNRMIDVSKRSEGLMLLEIESCLTMARQCEDAIVTLPHINEAGENTRHGDNMDMMRTRDVLIRAANELKLGLTFENYKKIDGVFYRYRYANGRFHSQEEWDKNFSHLNALIS